MKNKIIYIVVLAMLISIMPMQVMAADNGITDTIKEGVSVVRDIIINLTDIPTHWAKEFINALINKGVITGYPDGTFKPNANVTRAEAVKMLIVATGNDPGNSKDGHWALSYLNSAIDKGYILDGEFDDLNKEITRGELARMIVRALDEEYPKDINEYSNQIKDYDSISNEFKEYVLKAYVKGIITGYPDSTFKYNNNVTRAETSTMLVRFLEPTERKIPELEPVDTSDTSFIEPKFHIEYYTSLDSYDYFGIQLENWEDYEEHSEYYFTTECISHPEINYVNWKGLDRKFSSKTIDLIERSKCNYKKFYGNGQIYGLVQFYEWKPSNSDTYFNIEDGEMMKYKVMVTNNKETKEYYLDIEFKNKEFRYNNL